MKITPINFTTFLEPELEAYWQEHRYAEGKKIKIQRSHNLLLTETVVNAVAEDKQGNQRLLSSIQLAQIPQQEQHPALKGLVHLPHLDQPMQLLMVFKTETDSEKWASKIVEKLSILMLRATDDNKSDEEPDTGDPEPVEDSQEESEDE